MDYIEVRAAAEKWGVTERQVQRLLRAGRIPGAKRYGNAWMLPADCEKPPDRRKAEAPEAPRYLSCGSITAVTPLPHSGADGVLSMLPDARQRAQCAAELAYLRGDFPAVRDYFAGVSPAEPVFPCAAVTAMAAAVSLGDYPFYGSVCAALQTARAGTLCDADRFALELPEAMAAVSMIAPALAPQWLRRGDLTVLPRASRPFAVYLLAKYQQGRRDASALLACAQAQNALAATDGGFTFVDVYQLLNCAAACAQLHREAEAEAYVFRAMALALPHGLLTPFAEGVIAMGGLMEACFKQRCPEMLPPLRRQFASATRNWLSFHNRFTHDHLAAILTLPEQQAASIAARGGTNAEIAAQLGCSHSYAKKLLAQVFAALGVTRRAQLKTYIY